ncbi:MAG: heat-inducible transcription repressor HrcA [Ruminococcaceae bacterium]|nr:heat-inducible transcription repressor HrcA [Oscillospiraceae bacterium]
MKFNERKLKILQAIVDDYIQTAEPVGSSYLLGNHNLGVSSATVRNEMAALEESGYLDKPHTSAGRVPSYRGYRLYVNELMREYELTLGEINRIKNAMQKQYVEMNRMIADMSEMLSVLTHYTAVVTTPVSSKYTLRSIKLIGIDSNSFVMIVVTGEGAVKNRTIRTKKPFDMQVLEKLSNYLNNKFADVAVGDITPDVLAREQATIPVEDGLLCSVFDFLADTIDDLTEVDAVISGTTNIFNYPEFQSIERTRDFLTLLKDNKRFIKEVIANSEDTIHVIIGDENPLLKEHDLSIVVSDYSLGGNARGKVAVIGPTRMNYSRVVSTLDYLTTYLNEYIRDKTD